VLSRRVSAALSATLLHSCNEININGAIVFALLIKKINQMFFCINKIRDGQTSLEYVLIISILAITLLFSFDAFFHGLSKSVSESASQL